MHRRDPAHETHESPVNPHSTAADTHLSDPTESVTTPRTAKYAAALGATRG